MTAAALDDRDRNSGDEKRRRAAVLQRDGVQELRYSTAYSTITKGLMSELEDEIEKLKVRKKSTRFGYLVRVCQRYFVGERIKGNHHMFKTPWPGDPRINLQEVRGNAKPYQVEQVIAALERLKEMNKARK